MARSATIAAPNDRSIVFALRFGLFGRTCALDLGHCGALVLSGLCGAVVLWGLIAAVVLGFHDQIVTALVTQQADLSFGYEDQIANLRSQVSRESSRSLLNRHTLQTVLADLGARVAEIEDRQIRLGALWTEEEGDPTAAVPVRPASGRNRQSTLDLRSDRDHAAMTIDAVRERLERLASRQDRAAARLHDAIGGDLRRMTAAIDQAGVAGRLDALVNNGVGGPLVALPDVLRGENADGSSVASSAKTDVVAQVSTEMDHRDRLVAAIKHVPLGKPLNGPIEVSSTFGPRTDPFLGRPALHTGIDLHQSADDAVFATASGTVTVAGSAGGYGDMVEIDHGGGLATRYAHLSAIEVTVGQALTAGAIVGRVGSTGRSTGPHLHYETRVNGEPIDPARFLRAAVKLAGS